jgi:hypothetical protein
MVFKVSVDYYFTYVLAHVWIAALVSLVLRVDLSQLVVSKALVFRCLEVQALNTFQLAILGNF